MEVCMKHVCGFPLFGCHFVLIITHEELWFREPTLNCRNTYDVYQQNTFKLINAWLALCTPCVSHRFVLVTNPCVNCRLPWTIFLHYALNFKKQYSLIHFFVETTNLQTIKKPVPTLLKESDREKSERIGIFKCFYDGLIGSNTFLLFYPRLPSSRH